MRVSFLLFLFFTLSARAETYIIQNDLSRLEFFARQNQAEIAGQFTDFSGRITFHEDNLAESKVEVIINLKAITTAYQAVADNLQQPDWLDSAAFPEAIFTGEKFILSSAENFQYQIDGRLTIKGKSQPITLYFNIEQADGKLAKAQGQASLKRKDYQIGWADSKTVANLVKLNFAIIAAIEVDPIL